MSDLKDLRTTLSADLSVQSMDAAKGIFAKIRSDGVHVQKHLDSSVAELNSVVATITAARGPAK